MKVIVMNGSPRNGNSKTAAETMARSIRTNQKDAEVKVVDIAKKEIQGCSGCGYCQNHGGSCIIKDDANGLLEEVGTADVILFVSPVYWFGITAQLKLFIDRMYGKIEQFKALKKKIGIVAIGEDKLEHPQYALIENQFACMCDYLGWELIYQRAICAGDPGDLENNKKELDELKKVYALI